MPKPTHALGLKTSIQTFDAFVRCALMGNQPWPPFQNGIRERSVGSPLSNLCPFIGFGYHIYRSFTKSWKDSNVQIPDADYPHFPVNIVPDFTDKQRH